MFEPGSDIVEREVWNGRAWLRLPVRVDSDDGEVLAVVLEDGASFTFDDEEPAHPWSSRATWSGPTVLQLRRSHDWYSIWKFFDTVDGAARFDCWYVNFERPLVRTAEGIDVDDLELDLIVEPDGTRHWKDVEAVHARLGEGRFTVEDLLEVLQAAAVVSDLLDRDDRWWSAWDSWTPPQR